MKREQGTVLCNGELHAFAVAYGKRKTLQISVHADGRVMVKVPFFMDFSAVEMLVAKRSEWIGRKLAAVCAISPPPRPTIAQGVALPYLGDLFPLTILKGKHNVVLLSGKTLHMTVKKEAPSPADLENVLKRWYSERAREIFSERMGLCLPLCDFFLTKPPLLGTRFMRARWGSYSKKKGVTLNTNLIKASMECIDYVLLHELCHSAHQNHGRKFYSLLERVLPSWRERKNHLETAARFHHFI